MPARLFIPFLSYIIFTNSKLLQTFTNYTHIICLSRSLAFNCKMLFHQNAHFCTLSLSKSSNVFVQLIQNSKHHSPNNQSFNQCLVFLFVLQINSSILSHNNIFHARTTEISHWGHSDHYDLESHWSSKGKRIRINNGMLTKRGETSPFVHVLPLKKNHQNCPF